MYLYLRFQSIFYIEHLKRKTAEADGTTAPTDNSSAKSISTEQISQALAKVGQPTPGESNENIQVLLICFIAFKHQS